MRTFLNWKEKYENGEPPKEKSQNSEQIKALMEDSHDIFRSALKTMLSPYSRQFDSPQLSPPPPAPKREEPSFFGSDVEEFSGAPRKKKIKKPIQNTFREEEFEQFSKPEDPDENKDLYKLYKDKEEIFECNVTVEGASINSSQARLIIDTSTLNLVFYGKIQKDGKCTVPLRKMTFLPEKCKGTIRLEVIVDDTLFVPWESECIVEGSKKVSVQIKSKKKVTARI